MSGRGCEQPGKEAPSCRLSLASGSLHYRPRADWVKFERAKAERNGSLVFHGDVLRWEGGRHRREAQRDAVNEPIMFKSGIELSGSERSPALCRDAVFVNLSS